MMCAAFGKRRRAGSLAALALSCVTGWAQTELNFAGSGGAVRIVNADLAVLESHENRNDLACEVFPVKPEQGFDLRLHTGYRVAIPLKDLAGDGNELRVLFRVTPVEQPENRRYLVDRHSVPPIEEDAKGEASVPGSYSVGPGRYQVDWVMREHSGRVCSSHWEVEAKLSPDLRRLPLDMAPHTVAQTPQDPFVEHPPVQRPAASRLLHVKVLVNFSPSNPGDSTLKRRDVDAIVSIVRSIAREPHIGRFSLVAFDVHDQRVIYQEDNVERINFPALGKAVGAIKLGTVNYSRLQDPQSEMRFLASLLTEHLGPQHPEPDAVVIAGPKLTLNKGIPEEALKEVERPRRPIFYLSYNSNPYGNPWRDAIGLALKVCEGLEYSIAAPRDLGAAVADMTLRLSKLR